MCELFPGDAVFRKAKEGYELAMRSLGALLWYLRFSYLDDEIMSLTSFTEYVPVDRLSASTDLLLKSSKMVCIHVNYIVYRLLCFY